MHRRLTETAGAVEAHINEWEPRAATGGELLPIPSHLTLTKQIDFFATGEQKASTTSQWFDYKTRTDLDGQLTEEYKDYSGHYGTARSCSIYKFDWRFDWREGQSDSEDTFGYTSPLFDLYTGQRMSDQGGRRNHLTRLEDGTIIYHHGNVVASLRETPRKDALGTVWNISYHDGDHYEYVTEILDETGRIESAHHAINDETGKHDETLTYLYDQAGRLVREVKAVGVTSTSEAFGTSESRTETTEYVYNEDGTIDLQTSLGDGKVIRQSKRFYNSDGSFEHADTVEELPGEDRVRESRLVAVSYKYINEPLHLDIFWD
jgi:hypothetical protein